MAATLNAPKTIIIAALATIAISATARANRDAVQSSVGPVPTINAAVIETRPETAPAMKIVHKIARASDGLFYVDALVNGETMRFIVDTGASVVVLTHADARKIGLGVDDQHFNTNVQTVGGNTNMAMTSLNHVRIAGKEIRQIRAAVVRQGLGVSLLGLNALSQLGSVTIEGDVLSFQ
jgi:aspartyl protease family protein